MNLSNDIKLVATDLGGTLARDDGTISDFTIEVFRSVIDKGILVALLTGYNLVMTKKYADQISNELITVVQNGAMIFDNGELLQSNYLDKRIAKKVVTFFESKNFCPILFTGLNDGAKAYFKRTNNEFVGRDVFIEVEDFGEALSEDPIQISAWESTDKILACKEEAEELFGADNYVTVSIQKGRSWLEVLNANASKVIALNSILKLKGIKSDEVIYFGDNLNDLECLQAVEYPVVVSNGLPEVKEYAWEIAESNNEDGVAKFLNKYINKR